MSTRCTRRASHVSTWVLLCFLMMMGSCGTVPPHKARPNLNREHRLVTRQVQRPMMSAKGEGPLGACVSAAAIEKAAPESYIVLGWTLGGDGRARDVHARQEDGEGGVSCVSEWWRARHGGVREDARPPRTAGSVTRARWPIRWAMPTYASACSSPCDS